MKARPQLGTATAGRHAFSARSSFLTIREKILSYEADALFVMIGADAKHVMATRRFGAGSTRLYLYGTRPHHLETRSPSISLGDQLAGRVRGW